MNPVAQYGAHLRERLGRKISPDYVEEAVTETLGHLNERAEELVAGGVESAAAERRAVEEFGPVDEIAEDLAKGYPPKPPIDPRQLRWLPETAAILFLGFATSDWFIYRDYKGLESMASVLLMVSPMTVIPAFFGGLARFKFRRLRPISIQVRMARYGVILAGAGVGCLAFLQLTGHAWLTSMYAVYYLFGAVTFALYSLMLVFNSTGKIFDTIHRRLRLR